MTAPGETGIRVSLPPHAHLTEETTEYVITLDVSDFTERDLLPDDAEPSQVTASYSHGTLCIRVPRRGADHPHLGQRARRAGLREES